MATPFDVRMSELAAEERAEVERLLRERPSSQWHSDEGDGLVWHAILATGVVVGIGAYLINFSLAELADYFSFFVVLLPRSLVSAHVGFVLAVLLVPWLVWRVRVLHGRYGWMATSFGLLRVRGPELRVIRWAEVERVGREKIGGRNGFVKVTLTGKRGAFECDTGALFSEIKQRVPSTAVVDEKIR